MTVEISNSSNPEEDWKLWHVESYIARIYDNVNGKIIPVLISDETSIASGVYRITQFVMRAIKTSRPLFRLVPAEVISSQGRSTKHVIKKSSGGTLFMQCLRIDIDRILDQYPEIGKFNRYFGIFLDAIQESENLVPPFSISNRFDWLNEKEWSVFPDERLELLVRYLNGITSLIREKGYEPDFLRWQYAVQRQPCENRKRLLSLVDACLHVNHHLLVLRFDLGYGQFHVDPAQSGEMAVSYEEIREHRVALRRFLMCYLRDRLPPGACNAMACAVKMEYGLDKGYHFHVMVILNGNEVRTDINITEMIGNYWKFFITHGKGGFYNCNRMDYQRKGTGSIRHDDIEKLDVLRSIVIPYITKPDYYVNMVKPKRHRSFWCSQPPAIRAVKRGRPRSNGSIDSNNTIDEYLSID